jgi:hypothetical protein
MHTCPTHPLIINICHFFGVKLVLNTHFRLILSLHHVSEHGKVVFLKFVSIFSQKSEHLLFFLNVMNEHYSTLQCDKNALCLT